MPKFIKHPYFYVPTVTIAVVLAFLFLRKALFPTVTLPFDTIVVYLATFYLFIVMPLSILVMALTGLVQKLRKKSTAANRWFKRTLVPLSYGIGAFAIIAIVGVVSEFTTYTVPTVGSDQVASGGSIAEWKPVDINGQQQWLSIRGVDRNNPVILFVTGGPGISRVSSAQTYLRDLEDNYVVVTWDQPGAGKTFVDNDGNNDITEQTYVEDMNTLAAHLRQRFDEDKIYVIAESWGTIPASLAIAAEPEHYGAYFGTGQMVNMEQSQIEGHATALKTARENDDQAVINSLESQDNPPYNTENFSQSLTYLTYLNQIMAENTKINDPQIGVFNDIIIPELSINDEIGAFIAVSDTAAKVTPLAYDDDLRVKASSLDVPYYIFQGRHDINASNSLVEDYYQSLQAPDKDLVWFENSGHTPWTSESERFNKLVDQYISEL